MSLLRNKYPKIREKRLLALNSYFGDIDTLINEARENSQKQRLRTFSQGEKDEIIYASDFLSSIKNSVTVIHGPTGCSSGLISSFARNKDNIWFSSNINEKDSILGGDKKLKETIKRAYKKHKPEVIFVLTTPVVAINNDDVEGVIRELYDEINSKIIPIYTDGFKSKIATYGYDLAFHGIAKFIIKEKISYNKKRYINIISISENINDLEEIISLTKLLGIGVNLIPRFSNINSLKASANALFSISLNESEGEYIGQVLEDEFDVPFFKVPKPIGIIGIRSYLEEILNKVNRLIDLDDLRVFSKYKHLENKKILTGYKVYVNSSQGIALEISTLIRDLGGVVVGLTLNDINLNSVEQLENIKEINNDIKIHIANGQDFEEENILLKLKPDIYISEGSNDRKRQWVIPSIPVDLIGIYGYRALERFINSIEDVLESKNYLENKESIYKDSWLSKSANWYIKQEVK